MTLEKLLSVQASVSRRDFLSRMAIATGAGIIGCKSDTTPDPDPATLDNIIVVTMENRSFDHLLGWLPGAEGKQAGLSYLDSNNVAHPTFRLPTLHSCA